METRDTVSRTKRKSQTSVGDRRSPDGAFSPRGRRRGRVRKQTRETSLERKRTHSPQTFHLFLLFPTQNTVGVSRARERARLSLSRASERERERERERYFKGLVSFLKKARPEEDPGRVCGERRRGRGRRRRRRALGVRNRILELAFGSAVETASSAIADGDSHELRSVWDSAQTRGPSSASRDAARGHSVEAALYGPVLL